MVRRTRDRLISRPAFLGALLACTLAAPDASALDLVNRNSPKNKVRPRRARTDFIVLHTTEGAPKGALHKLRKNGEAHYLVDRDGTVYRIVDKDLVAYHAGRSMWDGKANLDRRSVGIEVVGYHHRKPKKRQIAALKELVRQLREIYDVPAERVLTHAQVAYGRPNRYHRYDHRGRKRCAMNLGTPKMREALGLGAGPARDPDVDAGRLRVADKKLFGKLFPSVALTRRGRPARRRGAVAKMIAKAAPKPAAAPTKALKAEPSEAPKTLLADAREALEKVAEEPKVAGAAALDAAVAKLSKFARAVKAPAPEPAPKGAPEPAPEAAPEPAPEVVAKAEVPEPTRAAPASRPRTHTKKAPARGRASKRASGLCHVTRERTSASAVAGAKYAAASTIYLLPDGRVRTGRDLAKSQARLLDALPSGTRVLKGKRYGGYVKPSRAPSEICGASWRSEGTVYRFPSGKLASGKQIDPARLPKATMVFCAS